MIVGGRIQLRLPQASDLKALLTWENNPDHWDVSETREPYSEDVMLAFIMSDHDLLKYKQLRLIIEHEHTPIGTLDLFDYDVVNQRCGIGILIDDEKRGQQFAFEAIQLLLNEAPKHWTIKQFHASMFERNKASFGLFSKLNFKDIGVRKQWYKTSTGWENERLMQFIYG